MYFNIYLNTYVIGSLLKPTILNRVIGKHSDISKNILTFQLLKKMLTEKNINIYQKILKKTAE